MHLLYLDDAGSAGNQNEDYLVLGGVSVFESQASWITQQLDSLAESIQPGDPHGVEFHASEIYSRRVAPWRGMSAAESRGVIKGVLEVLSRSYVLLAPLHAPFTRRPLPSAIPWNLRLRTFAAGSIVTFLACAATVIDNAGC